MGSTSLSAAHGLSLASSLKSAQKRRVAKGFRKIKMEDWVTIRNGNGERRDEFKKGAQT